MELIRLDEIMFFLKLKRESNSLVLVFEFENETALRFHLLEEKIEREFREDKNNNNHD